MHPSKAASEAPAHWGIVHNAPHHACSEQACKLSCGHIELRTHRGLLSTNVSTPPFFTTRAASLMKPSIA